MKIGSEIHEFARELWPINRSITGEGVRETLKKISHHLPTLDIKSVPSGTKVFDWEIPNEWYINEAYIIMPNGKKICNFSENNLYLVGYSIPFKGKSNKKSLKIIYILYLVNQMPYRISQATIKSGGDFVLHKNSLIVWRMEFMKSALIQNYLMEF